MHKLNIEINGERQMVRSVRYVWRHKNKISQDGIGYDRISQDGIGYDWIREDMIGLGMIRQDWMGQDKIGWNRI